MIVSERIKIQRANIGSTDLLEYIQGYFTKNITGEMLRFAISGVTRNYLVVDASFRVKGSVTWRKVGRYKHG